MQRISQKMLQARIDWLNQIVGFDPKKVSYDTVGAYTLDYAYGGVAVDQITNEGGGCRVIINRGTKKETFNCLVAFMDGLQAANELKER